MPNQHIFAWRDFTATAGHIGTDAKVLDLTGWPADVLNRMYINYGDRLPTTNARKPHLKQAYFFLCFRWIKLGPTVRELFSVLRTPHTGHLGKKAFYTHILPMIISLAEIVDEIKWEDRLARDNHCLLFPVGVTGVSVSCDCSCVNRTLLTRLSLLQIVDCFPIRVLTPRKWNVKKFLYQPKYGFAVLKVQLVISLKGEIIFASFPHVGRDHDSKIWKDSLAAGAMDFHDQEWILGDPAYISCHHCAVK